MKKRHMGACLGILVMLTACSGTKNGEVATAPETVLETETGGSQGEEAGRAEVGTEEAGAEEAGDEESGMEEAVQKERITRLLAEADWDQKAVYLPQIQQELERAGILWQGVYNRSGERMDMTLADGTRLIFLAAKNFDGESLGYELMMYGETFNSNGFQEHYQNHYDVTIDEEFYPETGTQVINPDKLSDVSMKQNQTNLSIARNEIFARHGRRFQDPFLQAVFQQKRWYRPLYDGEEFAAKQQELLSETEQANVKTIIRMEQDYGYRLPEGADYAAPECIASGSWLDLDGDGIKEKVAYQVAEASGTESYRLTVNDQEVSGEGENLYEYLYVASLDGRNLQLLAATAGASADYSMDVYSYEDGTLKANGLLPGSPESVQISKTRFSAPSQHDFFQTYPTRETYEMADGAIRRIDLGWYEFGNEASAIAEIPLYTDQTGTQLGITLQPGDKVVILGTDYREWVSIRKSATGETGWLRCLQEPGAEISWGYTCVLPDGSQAESYELFEGLIFYG